jgi:putative hydrolases of HD superfamily
MNAKELRGIITFLHESERLKTLLRHSWLSSGRRESVAEHSWRMALMAILINPYLKAPADLPKVLKMVLVHDLAEIYYKDNWAFNKQPLDKEEQERKSLIKLVKPLPLGLRSEIIDLWEEFEAARTPEALFAKFLDKTEVLLQHDEADIKFLNKKEIPLNLHHGKQYGEHDVFLKAFREAINRETLALYRKNKIVEELYSDWL